MSSPECLPRSDRLADLESFDPKVLISENRKDQELCNFILALALAYNDLKDCMWATSVLTEHQGKRGCVTKASGQLSGFYQHSLRRLYTVLNELIELIAKNLDVQNHPDFQDVLRSLSPGDREQWADMTRFAQGTPATDDILKMLKVVRDSMGAHYYMPKHLAKGYKKFFEKKPVHKGNEQAFLSRGNSAEEGRFYFADAASESAFEIEFGEAGSDFRNRINNRIRSINIALYQMVTRYVQKKSKGFYRVRN